MSLQIQMHLGSAWGDNVQQWYLWSLLELPNTGTVSTVVIINLFLFPKHKSFHGSFIPCATTGFQKQFQLKNKVLFFHFKAICVRVSVVYLASTLVFTYLFKEKKNGRVWFMDCSKSAIFCRTPNLRGYGERSHWPYTYEGPFAERGWIFFFFWKMSVSPDLWYAEHTWLVNAFAFSLQFGPMKQREWKI